MVASYEVSLISFACIPRQWRFLGLRGLGPKSSAGPLFENFLLTKIIR